MKSFFVIILSVLFIVACGSKPKVIVSDSADDGASSEMMTSHAAQGNNNAHTVVCKDFMHADKYTYMEVEENGELNWIAVPRQDVQKGVTYQYTGGLRKANFYSQEFDRTFETIVLVSGITRQGGAVDRAMATLQDQDPPSAPVNKAPSEGSVKISELMANPGAFEGKVISVTGSCVKINKMIMGRNWVHIEDGSTEGDLTVTTLDDVPVGATVTMTGTIGLNRDFGAGYRYDVIMENARVEK
jgi:hypothetical protein